MCVLCICLDDRFAMKTVYTNGFTVHNSKILDQFKKCECLTQVPNFFYTAILSKYRADRKMQTATPATTGVKRMFISFVLDVPTENPVIAMSPITRPRVPASVASSPAGIIR